MADDGPVVLDDPTAVVVRRGLAFVIDLAVTAALGVGAVVVLFSAMSVETTRTAAGCDLEVTDDVTVRERRRGRTWSATRTVTETPGFCAEVGSERIRYVPLSREQNFQTFAFVAVVVASMPNLVLLQGLTGSSLGKLLTGLRLVREDGSRPALGAVLYHWAVSFLDFLCCGLPGVALVLLGPGHQRLADRAARTYVVGRSAAGEEIRVPARRRPTA